jgi:hypothetical protein
MAEQIVYHIGYPEMENEDTTVDLSAKLRRKIEQDIKQKKMRNLHTSAS